MAGNAIVLPDLACIVHGIVIGCDFPSYWENSFPSDAFGTLSDCISPPYSATGNAAASGMDGAVVQEFTPDAFLRIGRSLKKHDPYNVIPDDSDNEVLVKELEEDE